MKHGDAVAGSEEGKHVAGVRPWGRNREAYLRGLICLSTGSLPQTKQMWFLIEADRADAGQAETIVVAAI